MALAPRVVWAALALALLGSAAAGSASAATVTVIHFQHESYQQLLTQLRNREVHAVVLHPKGYKAHVSLDDGGHMTVTYIPAEEPRLAEAARAGGASFTVATSTHKAAPVHHKLRYIAGAVLIVVILVVLVVLLVGRRRELVEADEPTTGCTAHVGHAHGPQGSPRRLAVALALILGFMAVEVAVGVLAHSLALISDAGHMLTDAAALGLSIVALRLAARPARGGMTYGFRRVEVLSAQVNGMTLLALACAIVYSAIGRLVSPPTVSAWPVVLVALAGIAINGAATATLAGAGRESMSVEGSYQHIVTDLFAFIATAVAGAAILLTGFQRADPIASLVVAALMLRAAVELLRASGRVFLEAAPPGLDPQEIGLALAAADGVAEVHDLHVWELSAGFPALSAHVLVKPGADCHAARRALEALLRERFQLEHTTLQVDHEDGRGLLEIQLPPG